MPSSITDAGSGTVTVAPGSVASRNSVSGPPFAALHPVEPLDNPRGERTCEKDRAKRCAVENRVVDCSLRLCLFGWIQNESVSRLPVPLLDLSCGEIDIGGILRRKDRLATRAELL